ncbi:hypothetical protein FD754_001978, partial [Muntiacus muntjak]
QYSRSSSREFVQFMSLSPVHMQCLEMTTKRKIIGRLVPCRCFRGEEEIISVLDYSHCSLQQVPKEVFNFERTLEELYLDANQIEELPKLIFTKERENMVLSIPELKICLVHLEFPDEIKDIQVTQQGLTSCIRQIMPLESFTYQI